MSKRTAAKSNRIMLDLGFEPTEIAAGNEMITARDDRLIGPLVADAAAIQWVLDHRTTIEIAALCDRANARIAAMSRDDLEYAVARLAGQVAEMNR